MALTREDWIVITQHLQNHVRQADLEIFELLGQHVELSNDPQHYLVDYLGGLIKVMSERSGGSHGRVLNEMNKWIRVEKGGPIRGIRLLLSETEQDLYQGDYVDLASLPDRSDFIDALRKLRDDLIAEIGWMT